MLTLLSCWHWESAQVLQWQFLLFFRAKQVLPVQITKDEVGSKGPRATLHLTIPGRNVVLMPRSSYIGTSHRIESEAERKRLYDIVTEACPEGMGVIIRTAAMGQSAESIRRDIRYLAKVWQSIEARERIAKNTGLLYRDVDLVIRIVRDIFNDDVAQMVIDDASVCQRVKELLKDIDAGWADRVQLYEGRKIFREYGIEDEIAKLESRYVELKSGGFLVIDKTEATGYMRATAITAAAKSVIPALPTSVKVRSLNRYIYA